MPTSSYHIVDHDPRWPLQFEQEKSIIVSVMSIHPNRVEHIGSTSIPGLGAKPIIDLMVGIPGFKLDRIQRHLQPLESIGYEYRGETVPGTLYLRKAEPRRYNLHMCEHGGEFWAAHVLFRDYLRSHRKLAQRYEDLKRQLIARLAPESDRTVYNDRKTAFINSVLEEARAEVSDGETP